MAKDTTGRNRPEAPQRALTRRQALALGGGGAALLAGCQPNTGPSISAQPLPSTGPITAAPMVPAGDTIGTGSVRVALLVPRSASGTSATIATALRNCAEMALNDFAGADVTLLVKDSGGTTEGAQAAAQAAVSEGAELILGPFFAAEVRGAAPVARAANIPVIAFSSDPSVAGNGVYIMGFLIGDEVQQMVAHAATTGKRSVGALISNSAAGNLAEAALRESAARYNVRIVQVERFEAGPGDIAAKAAALGANAAQLQAVFLPDGGSAAATAAGALAAAGLTSDRATWLGSGLWNDPAVYSNPALSGGLFPAPEIDRFSAFAARYRQAYGIELFAKATLAYDAALLAAGLVKQAGPRRFDPAILANRQGFISSVNGLFRFNPDGTNDRGLAIYRVTGGTPAIVEAPVRVFAGA
ncbi:penicillin-binding protein activator [Methylobrevis pamukkalensis]|uniref:Receptor family ligand binding region n=1 Tax=Methylobrevis pamukkalensis TaxID=1439726 RepID=A0A1E3H006_9HYPH|nr:penicillin-binding protein activator [Methylobrevis pamukkalensis]ODN69668.1 Receptor family ligand binding region [Methylobrevis pamukkalensis]